MNEQLPNFTPPEQSGVKRALEVATGVVVSIGAAALLWTRKTRGKALDQSPSFTSMRTAGSGYRLGVVAEKEYGSTAGSVAEAAWPTDSGVDRDTAAVADRGRVEQDPGRSRRPAPFSRLKTFLKESWESAAPKEETQEEDDYTVYRLSMGFPEVIFPGDMPRSIEERRKTYELMVKNHRKEFEKIKQRLPHLAESFDFTDPESRLGNFANLGKDR